MGPLAKVLTMKTVVLIFGCLVVGSWSALVDFQGNDPLTKSRFPERDFKIASEEEDIILAKLMPFVRFQCAGREPGFYVDRQFNCEVFHLCQPNGEMRTRMCPPKTRFNQDAGACEDETMVKCHKDGDFIKVATDGNWSGQLRDQIPPTSTATPVVSSSGIATEQSHKRVSRQIILTHRLIPRQTTFTQRQGQLGTSLAQNNNFLVPTNGQLFLLPQQPQFFRFNLPAESSQFVPVAQTGAQNPRAVQLSAPAGVISTGRAPAPAPINTVAQPIGSSSNSNRLQVESQPSPLRQGQLLVQQSGSQQIPSRSQQTSHHNQQQFQQQPPPNHRPQFDQDFFVDDGRNPNSDPRDQFFAPQRFHMQQDNRPQIGNNHPRNNNNQQQQGPPPPFFSGGGPLPPFSGGPPFDEEDFFRPNFPHGGPPSLQPQRPTPNNGQPNRPQQISTNFIIRPEDNALINGLHFPGPPQGQRAPPQPQRPPQQPSQSGLSSQNQAPHSIGVSQQRPPVQQQRPQSPQIPFQNRPALSHSGAAAFPSRFPPQSNNGFNLPPPNRFQDPFDQGLPNGFHQPPLQFPFAASPPRHPSQGVTSQQHIPTTTRTPTTHLPSTRPSTQQAEEDTVTPISGLRRPASDRPSTSSSISSNSNGNRFNSQDEFGPPKPISLAAPSSRPTPSSTSGTKRGKNKFHQNEDEDGSEFNGPDHTRPTPTRRPPQSNFDPSPLQIPPQSFGSDSAETFGIPPPSNDFGTKLGPDGIGHDGIQHFDTPTQRNPPSTSPASRRPRPTEQRPRPSEQFFSASPPRTAAGSSPFHPEDSFAHIMPPPSRPLSSSGEQFQRPPPQRTPSLHSTTEGSQRANKRPTHSGQHQNDHSTEHFDTSTELPDFFSSPQTRFPDLNDGRDQFNLQDNRRPNQDFPEDLFSLPPPGDFPSSGLQNGPFRGSFHPQHDASSEHNNLPKEGGPSSSSSSRPPRPEQNFNNFQQSPHIRPDDDRGSQFNNFEQFSNNGRFPDGPTFGPQSNDQLAPPELPPFTSRPDSAAGPHHSNFNDNRDLSNSQRQPSRDSPSDKPSTDSSTKPESIEESVTVSPTEITSTINEAPKRGSRPVGVTNAGRNGVRTRPPQRKRTRTRKPSTAASGDLTEATLIGDASTPAPRRRFRPTTSTSTSAERISSTSSTVSPRRRIPVPQKNSIRKNISSPTAPSKEVSGELSSQEPTSGESTLSSDVGSGKRRTAVTVVGKRVVAGRKGNSTRMVVRRRRPIQTSSTPSSTHSISGNDISSGTVDHSTGFSREPIFSSSNGRKNVAVVSRFNSAEDSEIAASQEQVTVTRAHAVIDSVRADDGSIQDHSSSLVTLPEKFEAQPTISSSTVATTTTSTTPTTDEELSIQSTISSFIVNAEEQPSTTAETIIETTTTIPPVTEELHPTFETTTTKKAGDKPEALSKLRSLLSRKFVIKLTTDAPQRR